MMFVLAFGTAFESKIQGALCLLIMLAFINFYVGICIPKSETLQAAGIVGLSGTLLTANFGPAFEPGTQIGELFGVYFTSGAGFMAGSSTSGDLKDPSRAIPKGTIIGLLITAGLDMSICWLSGASAVRHSAGTIDALRALKADEANGTAALWYTLEPDCFAGNGTCPAGRWLPYGLFRTPRPGLYNPNVFELMSAYSPVFVAGFMAATLSSALLSLISAGKVLQALCRDRLFPGSLLFERGFGKNDEPVPALFLNYAIAAAFCMIGDLNAIAALISNFFLASYALINYAVFDSSYANSPGFRPAFRYYNKWVSLAGAVVSLAIMFYLSWYYALVTLGCLAALYFYTLHHKPGAWQSEY